MKPTEPTIEPTTEKIITTTKQTPKPTPRTTPRPRVTTKPPGPKCISRYQAIVFDDYTGKSYIINEDKLYILGKKLGLEKGPIPVDSVFPGLERADAAYTRTDGRVVFFNGLQ